MCPRPGNCLIAKTEQAAHYPQALGGIYMVALIGVRVHLCVDSQLSWGELMERGPAL